MKFFKNKDDRDNQMSIYVKQEKVGEGEPVDAHKTKDYRMGAGVSKEANIKNI